MNLILYKIRKLFHSFRSSCISYSLKCSNSVMKTDIRGARQWHTWLSTFITVLRDLGSSPWSPSTERSFTSSVTVLQMSLSIIFLSFFLSLLKINYFLSLLYNLFPLILWRNALKHAAKGISGRIVGHHTGHNVQGPGFKPQVSTCRAGESHSEAVLQVCLPFFPSQFPPQKKRARAHMRAHFLIKWICR